LKMWYRVLISVGLIAGLWLLCWRLRGVMLTPVKPGKNERLVLLLRVKGPAPTLEQTVDSLVWLRANGTLQGEILLTDEGMDSDTYAAAQLLQRQGTVRIIERGKEWKQTN